MNEEEHHELCASDSVTRFGEISPRPNFNSILYTGSFYATGQIFM